MPLARLAPDRSTGGIVYCLTALDDSGRIRDRSFLDALGWSAGARLDIRERQGLIAVRADPDGRYRVTGQGFVLLPAPARYWCGLSTGDRVLLVADPAAAWMVVHPPAALEATMAAAHAAIWDGGAPS